MLISAAASGQGKTTVTAAIARRARQDGRSVRLFKTGPDFIDPTILSVAAGCDVETLDLWMVGEAGCRRLLADAAAQADLVLVEGVMGLFDGTPSSADLALRFDLPVLAVIDASAMAQTFGAVAKGLAEYRPGLHLHGVVANRVGGEHHARMLRDSLRAPLHWLGHLPQDARYALPERHLGLVQAAELEGLDARLDDAAAALGTSLDVDAIPQRTFTADPAPRIEPRLRGLRIAIARDAAHSFLYPANVGTLEALGAEVLFFSPLRDAALPAGTDAVYLPGGYPELHARALSENRSMQEALRAHHAARRPLLAECGGMMTVFDALVDREGVRHAMAGLLPGETAMQERLQVIGAQSVQTSAGVLRGHSFHHSRCATSLNPWLQARDPLSGPTAEPVYRMGATVATYVHFYFASDPVATAALFGA